MENLKILRYIVFTILFSCTLSSKRSRCFVISAYDSGIHGYVTFNQENENSPLIFDTTIFGTDEITDFKIHKNEMAYKNNCSVGEELFSISINDREKMKNSDEIVILEGEIKNASLFKNDLDNTSCVVYYKDSRKNRVHKQQDPKIERIGGCGKIQNHETVVIYTFGAIFWTVVSVFLIVYFSKNKL